MNKEAIELIGKGYAVTSRRHGIVARVDREDWRELSLKENHPADADYYRRVLSKDTITVPEAVWRAMPNSNDCKYAFVATPRGGE